MKGNKRLDRFLAIEFPYHHFSALIVDLGHEFHSPGNILKLRMLTRAPRCGACSFQACK